MSPVKQEDKPLIMDKINTNFQKLKASYLFSEMAHRMEAYLAKNPSADLIKMGIGDVTRPLAPAVIQAMHDAVDEFASVETMKGYGPELGYLFLRQAIADFDYGKRGVKIDPSEIFISDGAKSDTANFSDLFGPGIKLGITNPVYPVYVDANVIGGHAGEPDGKGNWSNIYYLACNADNNFVPEIPKEHLDVLYLCFPNNPCGTTLTKVQLKEWVDYAKREDALIFFDSAYERFITEEDVPHTIYEIEGAEEVAVEFRSFSKTAGFTGVRCGYTVVPHAVKCRGIELNPMWARRQTTKFNGASYISQRGAAAIYTPEGHEQAMSLVRYYLENAKTIRSAMTEAGYECFGGVSAPYVWVKNPSDFPDSWDMFQYLMEEKNVICTPGIGFGTEGQGYFRLSAFNSHELTNEAMKRIIGK